MQDQWDVEASPSLPWYRRFEFRWGLCTSLMLVLGFFLGWSTTCLRPPDANRPPDMPAAIRSLDPLTTLGTVSIDVAGQAEGPDAQATAPGNAVTQRKTEKARQGS